MCMNIAGQGHGHDKVKPRQGINYAHIFTHVIQVGQPDSAGPPIDVIQSIRTGSEISAAASENNGFFTIPGVQLNSTTRPGQCISDQPAGDEDPASAIASSPGIQQYFACFLVLDPHSGTLQNAHRGIIDLGGFCLW